MKVCRHHKYVTKRHLPFQICHPMISLDDANAGRDITRDREVDLEVQTEKGHRPEALRGVLPEIQTEVDGEFLREVLPEEITRDHHEEKFLLRHEIAAWDQRKHLVEHRGLVVQVHRGLDAKEVALGVLHDMGIDEVAQEVVREVHHGTEIEEVAPEVRLDLQIEGVAREVVLEARRDMTDEEVDREVHRGMEIEEVAREVRDLIGQTLSSSSGKKYEGTLKL
eukprot:TRINITY_DN2231_c0_g1_i4.p2 TRINITY_DN2231_c0_g1~~TRINITY_DN2231_c0_g1_i4.p2  ORF type:complete len:223 (+),score=58.88 TRINITY_DN2231_c0_g1_i4:734-1402(+)